MKEVPSISVLILQITKFASLFMQDLFHVCPKIRFGCSFASMCWIFWFQSYANGIQWKIHTPLFIAFSCDSRKSCQALLLVLPLILPQVARVWLCHL